VVVAVQLRHSKTWSRSSRLRVMGVDANLAGSRLKGLSYSMAVVTRYKVVLNSHVAHKCLLELAL
jgi:hypothetical protein